MLKLNNHKGNDTKLIDFFNKKSLHGQVEGVYYDMK
jgi:hypothetical protein